jgi:hypothetical protein
MNEKAQAHNNVKPLNPPPGATAPAVTKNASAAAVAGTETKAPKAPKVPKEPKESNFKKVYPDSAKIAILTEGATNPKRKGTKAHDTFELYAKNATVGEFIKAGGFYAALSWDVGHGFIKVG